MSTKDDYFVPENADLERRKEILSPSGKYLLVTTPFSTKKNCWSYTQGLVYLVGSDEPLFEVRRNYHSFTSSWIEDHPNGHSYLVTGEDYQGQTVLELDTGKRRDHLPEEAKKGAAFCWVDVTYRREDNLLVVEGCYWACPYEFRLYDFSNPMSGWTQIGEGVCINADDRKPTFHEDGTITTYQTEYNEDAEEDENGELKLQPIAATITYKREGRQLTKVDEWVSEKEQKSREEYAKARRDWDQWYKTFTSSDPLYLRAMELVADAVFKPESNNSIGWTHDTWCPDFKEHERRMCRRISEKGSNGYTIDLEWGVNVGPVKLVIYKDGKHVEDKFFMEHSVTSIEAALAHSKSLLTGSP